MGQDDACNKSSNCSRIGGSGSMLVGMTLLHLVNAPYWSISRPWPVWIQVSGGAVYVFGVSSPVPWRPSESCASTKARMSCCICGETASSCRCSPSMSSVIDRILQNLGPVSSDAGANTAR